MRIARVSVVLAALVVGEAHARKFATPAREPQTFGALVRGSPLHARSARLATALSIRGGADSLKADDDAALTTDGIEHEQPQPAVTTEPKAVAAALAETVKGGASAAVTPTPTAIVGGRSLPQMISRALGIDVHEFPKFLAMSFMMFAIIYIFTMTRDTKDVLIVTNCGAESIAFLKVYGVVPAAALFMLGYNFLSNHVSSRTLFHLTILPFFAFYALFGFVMYPMRDKLHNPAGALLQKDHGLAYLINLSRYWMFSLYYIVSELWGSAGIPLLFWTCANEVTPISQAKRFYSLFGLLGNLAPIASGRTMVYVKERLVNIGQLSDEGAFEGSIRILTGIMMVAGAITIALYEFVYHVHQKELAAHPHSEHALEAKKPKDKMGLIESFRFLAKSKYLGHIALIVLSYGLSMEFTEIIWKAIVKLKHPDKTNYMAFMGQYSQIVGASTFVMMLFGNKLIKHFGWEFGALMTPVMMAVLALPFFGFLTLGKIGANPDPNSKALATAVYIGMVQNILSKATKYAVFDPTKEMAYIPLDRASKVKGKAAIDVLGARLGKSGGALAQQALVMAFGTIVTGAPVLAAMFAVVSVMWITSVINLGKEFRVKSAVMEQAAADNAARTHAALAQPAHLKHSKKH